MKKIAIISATLLLGLTACKEPMEELVDPAYSQLFSPTEVSAAVSDIINATITWGKVTNATGYVLELHKDMNFAEAAVQTDSVEETAFTYNGLDEGIDYAVRIKAVSDKIPESKWAVIAFATVAPPPPTTNTWEFGGEEFAEITNADYKETLSVRGLEVIGGAGGVRRNDEMQTTIGDRTFTGYLDLRGGAGASAYNTNRTIHLKVEEPCVVTVWGHSSGAGRTLKVVNKDNVTQAEYLTTGDTPGKVSVNVETADDIYIYSGGSGIWVYAVEQVIGGQPVAPDETTTLRSLAVTGETLIPAFDPDETRYTVNVAKSVTEVTIAAEAGHVKQTVEGDGRQYLPADSAVFLVKVTAEDGVSVKTYSITVKREKTASSDATLKSLTVSGGTLSPDFAPTVTEYTVTVPYSVNRVTINGETTHEFAKIGNGGALTAPAPPDTLLVGSNGPYPMVVLAEDLTMKTYSVTVVREAGAETGGTSKEWNFSDEAFSSLSSIDAEETVDGLTLIGKIEFDGSKKSLDDYSFTRRLKLGGTGSTTSRAVKFDVAGACTVTVYSLSSSSSADRTLIVHDGTTQIGTIEALGSVANSGTSKGSVSYTGESGSLYLYSESSGINLYLVKVDY
jgi:hypothetical protein